MITKRKNLKHSDWHSSRQWWSSSQLVVRTQLWPVWKNHSYGSFGEYGGLSRLTWAQNFAIGNEVSSGFVGLAISKVGFAKYFGFSLVVSFWSITAIVCEKQIPNLARLSIAGRADMIFPNKSSTLVRTQSMDGISRLAEFFAHVFVSALYLIRFSSYTYRARLQRKLCAFLSTTELRLCCFAHFFGLIVSKGLSHCSLLFPRAVELPRRGKTNICWFTWFFKCYGVFCILSFKDLD